MQPVNQSSRRKAAGSGGRQKVRNRAVAAAILLGVFFIILAGYRYYTTRQALADITRQGQRLHAENEELRQEIDRLKNDPDFLEEVARHKFGLLKKDETVFEFKKKRENPEEK